MDFRIRCHHSSRTPALSLALCQEKPRAREGPGNTAGWSTRPEPLYTLGVRLDLLLGNWELALLLSTWSAIGAVSIRRQYDWRHRRFTQQVNFSLTTPVQRDGAEILLLRTLLEESAANVWLNEFGVSRVLKAARLTTPEMPFLRIVQRHDRDLVMNAVLNVLSERFSDAFVARAVGVPIKTDIFLFGLTWER